MSETRRRSDIPKYTRDYYGTLPEYYGSLVECEGRTFLMTRIHPYFDKRNLSEAQSSTHYGWRTRVRLVPEEDDEHRFAFRTHVLAYHEQAHNAVGICLNHKVYMLGGTFKSDREESHWRGIYVSESDPFDLASFARISRPELVFTGHHAGCVEARKERSGCEFDGKLSAVVWKGEVLLFSRANTGWGYRHVQVTRSKDLREWSPFKLLEMEGVDPYKSSIYFLTVARWRDGSRMHGFFPGVMSPDFLRGTPEDFLKTKPPHAGALVQRPSPSTGQVKYADHDAGIWRTWSSDGVHWTRPALVHRQLGGSSDGRVYIHPVGILRGALLTMTPTGFGHAFMISQRLTEEDVPVELTNVWNFTLPRKTPGWPGGPPPVEPLRQRRKRGQLRTELAEDPEPVYDMSQWND